jgi:hypothetical protein
MYLFGNVPVTVTPLPKDPNINKLGKDPKYSELLFSNSFKGFSARAT